jgi:hypothetical protein
MLSGDSDEVVPKKHMHTLWEIATKRGQLGKDSSELSNESPPNDSFQSFPYGRHGE